MPRSRPSNDSQPFLGLILPAIVLLCAASLCAQHAPSPSSPKYDLQAETTMKGTVDDVKLPSSAKEIVYLLMKTGTDTTVDVYLCPKSFLDDMGESFAKGDQITLTASKVKEDDADIFLAREIVKGTDTLVLRDAKGKPVWN